MCVSDCFLPALCVYRRSAERIAMLYMLRFGNYTAQRIIQYSRGEDWQELRRRIEVLVPKQCFSSFRLRTTSAQLIIFCRALY